MPIWAVILFGYYIIEVVFAKYQRGFIQYGKPYLHPIFNHPNNGNFNRPGNVIFHPSTNGNFNQPSGGTFNPSNGNFNRPGNGIINRPGNGIFNPLNQNVNRPGNSIFNPLNGNSNHPGNGHFNPSNGNFNHPDNGIINRPGNGIFNPPNNNANRPGNNNFKPSNGNFNHPGNGIINRPGNSHFNPPNNNPNRPGNSNFNPSDVNSNRPGNGNFNPNGNFNRPGNGNFNPSSSDYNRPGNNRPPANNGNIGSMQTQRANEIVNAEIEKMRNRITAALQSNNQDISYAINSYLQSESMNFVEATLDRRTGHKLQLLNTTFSRRATILAMNLDPPSSPPYYFDETEQIILENFNFRLNRRYNSQNNSLEPNCVQLSTSCVVLGSKIITPNIPIPQTLSLSQYRPVKIVTTNDRNRVIETITSNYVVRVIDTQRNQGRGSFLYSESEDLILRDRIFHTDKKYDSKSKTIEITTYNYLANQARPSRVRATLYRVDKCTFNLIRTRN